MNLDYDEYGSDLDPEFMYGRPHAELLDQEVNPDLQGMGRQYLE
jgi:hypothetical protein